MKNILHALIFGAVLMITALPSFAHGVQEPEYPPYCWVQPPGSELWYRCGSEEAEMANCLRLMETAMKAVDPFVLSLAEMNASNLNDNDKDHVLRALKVWDRAKKSCWIDFKNLQPRHHH